MKASINIAVIFFIGIVCLSCQSKKYCDLTITLSSKMDYCAIDSAFLFNGDDHYRGTCSYDSATNGLICHWDSLESGNYGFQIQTIFCKVQNFPIDLEKDTNIRINGDLEFHKTELIERNELNRADTIEFVYTSDGCFHCYLEKSILIRNKSRNCYYLTTVSNEGVAGDESIVVEKKIPPNVIDSLFQLELDSKTKFDLMLKDGIYKSSTTTNRFYLLADNKLFYFSDQGIQDWDFYSPLKRIYFHLQ
jgi:hypothetical protein